VKRSGGRSSTSKSVRLRGKSRRPERRAALASDSGKAARSPALLPGPRTRALGLCAKKDVTVQRVSFGDYLDAVGSPRSSYETTRLNESGLAVFSSLTTSGHKGDGTGVSLVSQAFATTWASVMKVRTPFASSQTGRSILIDLLRLPRSRS
jgi:hypothetical protein